MRDARPTPDRGPGAARGTGDEARAGGSRTGPVRVALFGEALWDAFPRSRRLGGAPLNVAAHLRGLGFDPLLVTRVGADAPGRALAREMRRRGLGTRGVQVDGRRPTGQAVVQAGPGGPSFRIPPGQAFDAIASRAALDAVRAHRPAALYFGTLAQRSAASRRALAALLAGTSCPRFVDLNLRPPAVDPDVIRASTRAADVLKASAAEAVVAARVLRAGRTPAGLSAPERLFTRIRAALLLVTRGDEGASAWASAGGWLAAAQVPRRPLPGRLADTVGAGDAFSAAALAGWLSGWPVTTLLRRAAAFARAVCTIHGALPDDLAFYGPFRRSWRLDPP